MGAISVVHAEHLGAVEGVRLYAVCDVDKDRADRAAKTYGALAYYDYDKCLEDENIHSVHICTPHYLHFEMIEKALAKGKKVVCEKPVVMTEEELGRLLSLPGGDEVCVVMQNRLNPCVLRMKKILDKGSLGRLVAVKGLVTWFRSKEYYGADSWRGRWSTEGGGVLINQAIHVLDLMCMFGGRTENVCASTANYSLDTIEVEDSVMARICFSSGASGMFFATNAYGKNSPVEVELLFEEGILRYTDGMLLLNGEKIEEDSAASVGRSYWGTGHRKLFERIYMEGERFCPGDVENTMRTLFAMYRSAKNGSLKEKTY